MRKNVFLGLGSNLGERVDYLKKAIQALDQDIGIEVLQVSSLYETSPVGPVEQEDFLNLVLEIQTTYSPYELLKVIHKVEANLERIRDVRWGPRTIDIDLLYFDQIQMNERRLTLPHSQVMERLFVLVPLRELLEDSTFLPLETIDERIQMLEGLGQTVKNIGQLEWEESSLQAIEDHVKDLLIQMGEDPDRPGLLETPNRVARMYQEIFSSKPGDQFTDYKLFETEISGESQMVMVHDMTFYSMCEHHMLPFFGSVHVAYLPKDGQIIGLSKIPRLVDFVSRKLSVQEEVTRDVATIMNEILDPYGVAVIVDARHMCMEMRGIKEVNSITRTTQFTGLFKEDPQLRNEFLQSIG